MRRVLLALLLTLGIARAGEAQGVVVAPHAVYLDHRTRSASITLYNPGADPLEVTISSMFGYPVTDSVGHFTLLLPDSVDASMPSATAWIEAFPRRMTIPPLQRQTVRLLARPPQGLADGEYWSRVMISARGGSVPVSGADSVGIAVGLTLEVRTVIPLIYRKGQLTTGVAISNLRTRVVGDSIAVRVHLERQGTSAYIGTAKGALLTEAGETIASFQVPVAIYYDAEPEFMLPLGGRTQGNYRLRLELATDRTDIASEQLLRAAVTRDSVVVTLP
jgi:P pilus assembly chaperone PapD